MGLGKEDKNGSRLQYRRTGPIKIQQLNTELPVACGLLHRNPEVAANRLSACLNCSSLTFATTLPRRRMSGAAERAGTDCHCIQFFSLSVATGV